MSLITCPECGKEVSDKASFCPNCGCPIEKENTIYYSRPTTQIDVQKEPESKFDKALKIILVIIIGLFVLIIIAVNESNEDNYKKSVIPKNVTSEVATETKSEEIVIDNVETVETKSEMANEEIIIIDKKEIYNENDVLISIKEIEVKKETTEIKFEILNSSSKDYKITPYSCVVNGFLADTNVMGFGGVNVPTGKNANLKVELDNLFLTENRIDVISEIDMVFWAYGESMKEWDSGCINIRTNYYNENNRYNPVGTEVYSDENILLYCEEQKDQELVFVILNKTNRDATYTVQNCSINNWAYEITDYTYDLYDEIIPSNSYTKFVFKVNDDFMKENGFDKIDNLEFDIKLYDFDLDNWNNNLDVTSEKIIVKN